MSAVLGTLFTLFIFALVFGTPFYVAKLILAGDFQQALGMSVFLLP